MDNDNSSHGQQRRLPQHEQLVENANWPPQGRPSQQQQVHPLQSGGGVSSITQRLFSGQVSGLGVTVNNNIYNLLQTNLWTMSMLEPTPIASHRFHRATTVRTVPTFGVHDDLNLLQTDRNMQLRDILRPLLHIEPAERTTATGAPIIGSVINTTGSSQLPRPNVPHLTSTILQQPYSSSLFNHQIDSDSLLAHTTGSRSGNTDSRGQHHNLFVSESSGVGAITKIDHPLLLDSLTTMQSTDRRSATTNNSTTRRTTTSRSIGGGGRSSLSNIGEMKQTSPPTKRKMYVDPSATSESKSQRTSPTREQVATAAATILQPGDIPPDSAPATKRRKGSSRGRRQDGSVKDDRKSKTTSEDVQTPDASSSSQAANQGISTTSSPQRFRSYQNEQWNKKFQELCEYRRQHGNCNVPSSHDRGLSKWVKRQRYQYKLKHKQAGATSNSSRASQASGEDTDTTTTGSTTATTTSTLTDERQHALEGIGFVWHSHESAWEERYEELREFYSTNGHCNVPTNYPANTALPLWLQSQRRQYRLFVKGERSFMTEERIAKLSSIGFIFTPRGGGSSGSTTRQPSFPSSSSTK